MRVYESLEEFSEPRSPLVLTIGNFDGMHRGHCTVLKKVIATAGTEGQSAVLTFRNHPSEVLRPDQPIALLCSLPHRIRMLEGFGIDDLILLTFTRKLAQHNAAFFIENIRQTIPFTHLILGHDATLGRDRQGDRSIMQELADQWGFSVQYIEEYRYEGKPVSSSRIRAALQQGDLTQVEELLDRPYSIYGRASKVAIAEKPEFPLFSLDLTGLCLPPFGVYIVEVMHGSKRHHGIASLSSGFPDPAQTQDKPCLFVHLIDSDENMGDSMLEVIFKSFVRPEIKFNDLEEFIRQIQLDIKEINQT